MPACAKPHGTLNNNKSAKITLCFRQQMRLSAFCAIGNTNYAGWIRATVIGRLAERLDSIVIEAAANVKKTASRS